MMKRIPDPSWTEASSSTSNFNLPLEKYEIVSPKFFIYKIGFDHMNRSGTYSSYLLDTGSESNSSNLYNEAYSSGSSDIWQVVGHKFALFTVAYSFYAKIGHHSGIATLGEF
jgi:hypothetical protein